MQNVSLSMLNELHKIARESQIKQNQQLARKRKSIQLQRLSLQIKRQPKNSFIIPLQNIKIPQLQHNQHYKVIIHRIDLYNRGLSNKSHDVQMVAFKNRYFQSMMMALKTISVQGSKQRMIDQIRQLRLWSDHTQQIISKSLDSRKFNPYRNYICSDNQNPQPTLPPAQPQTVPAAQIHLPSTQRQQILNDYQNGHRSICHGAFTPAQRLTGYSRKQISMIGEQKYKQSNTQGQYKISILNSDFTKPPQPPKQQQEQQELKPDDNQQQIGQTAPIQQMMPPQMAEQLQQEEKQQPKQELNRLMPYYKPFIQKFKKKRFSQIATTRTFDSGYLFHKPDSDRLPVKAMDDVYKKRIQGQQKQKKDNDALIIVKKRWAAQKARFYRQSSRRAQIRVHQPKSKPMQQPVAPPQKFSQQDQHKYFSFLKKSTKKARLVNINSQLQSTLPILNQRAIEKQIARKRVVSLRKDYGSILGISQQDQKPEDGSTPASLVQHTGRRKAFSDILKQHSPQNQRQSQINDIRDIKQRLSKRRVFLNNRILADGLCLPNYGGQSLEGQAIPTVNLQSNPFEQPQKKKKK